MRIRKLSDEAMAALASKEKLERMEQNLGTKPRVWYRNLWRYNTVFVAGSVSYDADGIMECAAEAAVKLSKGGRHIAETQTDIYGDFKFDKLEEASGDYTIEISFQGRSKTVEARLGASIYLGEVRV